MANLMFKRGSQASLNQIITGRSATDGCFYLTEDTHRLYISAPVEDNKYIPVLLNQTVQIIDQINSLPQATETNQNDFYYAVAENILAVSINGKWQQINPDTDHTVKVVSYNKDDEAKGSKFDKGEVILDAEGVPTGIKYTLTLRQQTYNKDNTATGALIEATIPLELSTDLVAQIVPESSKVDLTAKVYGTNDKAVSIKTAGAGSMPNTQFVLQGGNNVESIELTDAAKTASDPAAKIAIINVKDTTYEVNVDGSVLNEAKVSLYNNDSLQSDSDVILKADQDLTITTGEGKDDNKNITFAHKIYTKPTTTTVNEDKDVELTSGDDFDIISGLTLSNGHISGISTSKIYLPEDIYVNNISQPADWKAVLERSDLSTNLSIDFSAEATALQAALEKKITDGLAAANTALTYKGTVPSYEGLPTTKVELGDVYLLNSDDINYKKGDLFIATYKEGLTIKPGEIKTEDLLWQCVPSGDELNTDTLFKGVANVTSASSLSSSASSDTGTNGSFSFAITAEKDDDGTDLTPDDNKSLQVKAGNLLEVVKKTASNSDEEVAIIRHKNISTNTPTASDADSTTEFTAITGLEYTDGHITKVTKETFKPISYELSGAGNSITLKDDDETVKGSVAVSGDSWIATSVSNNVFSITHKTPVATGATEKKATNTSPLTAQGTLNIISSVKYDSKGHVVSVDTSPVTLPEDKDTTYDFYLSSTSTGNELSDSATISNPYFILKDKDETKDSIQLKSTATNLNISATKGLIDIQMVWGSF